MAERLFKESAAEKSRRKRFHNPGGENVHADERFSSISASGTLGLQEPIDNFSEVTVQFVDRNGEVIASQVGEVQVSFAKSEADGVVTIERKHKVKL